MEKKKCEVSQNESTPLPSNCNEVISRYELLQELHRRDQDSEEIVETINDMTPKGVEAPPVPNSNIVVFVDIMPMNRRGNPMVTDDNICFLATLNPIDADRFGITADYAIDIGEKHVVLHKDGSMITNVFIGPSKIAAEDSKNTDDDESETKFERLRKQTNDALAKFAEPFVKSTIWQGKMHYFFEYDWEEHRLLISTTSVLVGGGFYFTDRVEALKALNYIGAVDILKYHLGIPAIEVAKHRARIEATIKELNERYGD